MECPICSFRLKQHTGGFRCVKCHAHFSAKFIRSVKRKHDKHLIETHFGTPKVVGVEEETITFTDPQTEAVVERVLKKHEGTIDDYIDLTGRVLEKPVVQLHHAPHEFLQKERASYAVKIHTPERNVKKKPKKRTKIPKIPKQKAPKKTRKTTRKKARRRR